MSLELKPQTHVGVIDYGAGNLQSVVNAFKAIGASVSIVSSPQDLLSTTHLVLPGQGEFGDCADKLRASGLFDSIKDWIKQDRSFLGICVGYQLLFESSSESPDKPGLGVFKGSVRRFESKGLKVPHMGWNALSLTNPQLPLWKGLGEEPYFYFIHSYFPQIAQSQYTAGTCIYGEKFDAAIAKGRVVATQFHPEKSQDAGLALLKNFLLYH